MINEFDLTCATCGGPLTRQRVSADHVGVDTSEPLTVAECVDCGGRYFPESTLERFN